MRCQLRFWVLRNWIVLCTARVAGRNIHFSKKKELSGVAVLNPVALQCSHFHVFVGEFVGVLL